MEIRDDTAPRKNLCPVRTTSIATRRRAVDTTAPLAADFRASGKARFIPGIGLVVDGGGLES
ncbi:MAG TPA: hypothetical protein VKA19_12785 [Alphaproteobacteria bacterium]|nr:hypothetical protein [Alphaproteobacteria bacterium]